MSLFSNRISNLSRKTKISNFILRLFVRRIGHVGDQMSLNRGPDYGIIDRVACRNTITKLNGKSRLIVIKARMIRNKVLDTIIIWSN